MTPVRPPNKNVTRKPIAHSIGVSNDRDPPHIVPIQLKNFTPVGTAMSMVMMAKNGSSTWPVAYMWCAQTLTESAAIAMVAKIMPL
jgi:hypothetical protein